MKRGITAEFRWQPREEMEAADRISKWEGEWRLSEAAMTRLRRSYAIEFDVVDARLRITTVMGVPGVVVFALLQCA